MPTKIPQPARGRAASPASRTKTGRPGNGRVVANGAGRAAIRGDSEVIELEHGITVYPAREEKGRWRAVWYEDGQRQQCEGSSEEKLAAKLEKGHRATGGLSSRSPAVMSWLCPGVAGQLANSFSASSGGQPGSAA